MIPPPRKLSLAEALSSAQETRALEIGSGILGQTPRVFREQFPKRSAVVVADENTFNAAGQRVAAELAAAGLATLKPFIFPARGLHAEHAYVEQLEAALRPHDAIPVAVGSGTVNDLTKLAAHRTGRPYMCVATAASMDGYTAFGASITYQGAKQTFLCPAPTAVVADLEVICAAPGLMNAWGYADLLAKVPAGADWILADAVGSEPIHPQGWAIVQGRLREMVGDPAAVAAREPAAVGKLLEGLMLGGFAMQASRGSRAASGAEHQFSHMWDMQHHTHNGVTPSHGFKVGIGTLAMAAFYECLLAKPLERMDVDACCAAWPDADAWVTRARELLKEEQLVARAETELKAKHSTPEELRAQLVTVKAAWPKLREELRSQLLPLATLRQMLRDVGAPTEPEQIGITRERLRQTFWMAYCIRRRFNALDLAIRTRVIEACLDQVFGPDGPWPISPGARSA
jgi:glycerol-1-phosphate dehydrogenase [NAD(P)+]